MTVTVTRFLLYMFLLPFLWFLEFYLCFHGLIVYELLLFFNWGSILGREGEMKEGRRGWMDGWMRKEIKGWYSHCGEQYGGSFKN